MKTVGFPRIHNYIGDIRDYTPNLFAYLDKFENFEFYLEKGYGEGLSYCADEYEKVNSSINWTNFEDAMSKEIVVILKMPSLKDLELLTDGSTIFTMCHFETREDYVRLFERKNINAISMDAIVDDDGLRMFVDYFGTAFNGCETAFNVLKEREGFYANDRKPFVFSIIGAGGVGQLCAKSMEILSDKYFLDSGSKGAVINILTRSITTDKDELSKVLYMTDILIDASKRLDFSKHIIDNDTLGNLPDNAIILDLSADRYVEEENLVRALEGTVKGTPQHTVLMPDDEEYDKLPDFVNKTNRRIVVSCDAWPSVAPAKSIEAYEKLMKNYMHIILSQNNFDIESDNLFERGLHRSTLSYYLRNKN